jgi:hypothetical protein
MQQINAIVEMYYYVKSSMFKFKELLKNYKRTMLTKAIYKRAMTQRASATRI